MSRFGLDVALDTIGIVHGLYSACNISTYIDSTGAKVEVPFAVRGPVNLSNDVIKTNLLSTVDLADGIERNFNFPMIRIDEISDQFDYIMAGFTGVNGTGFGILRLLFVTNTLVQLTWKNDSNVDKAITPTITLPKGESVNLSIVISSSMLKITINSSSVQTTTIGAGTSTLSSINVGAFSKTQFNTPCLVSSFESSVTGFVNFISNANDGGTFNSTNGTVFTLDADASGNEQLPNYTLPVGMSPTIEPQTGDIYNGATLLGNRDRLTGDFTPDVGEPGAYLESDTPCGDNPLVINELTGIAVINELTGEFVINESV